jgi:tetratricopeptide (TPR) repeat protein
MTEKSPVFGKINSRVRAKSVRDSTIIGVQTGLNEEEVGTLLDQLLRLNLRRVGLSGPASLHTTPTLELELEAADQIYATSAHEIWRVENAYERAVELIGAGEIPLAETILLNILAQLSIPGLTIRGHNIRARTAMRVGAIRRDRGLLGGIGGAFYLFKAVFETADYLKETGIQTEAAISLASSYEMSEQYDAAYRTFGDAHGLALANNDVWYQLWAKIRQQTIATKSGEAESASRALERLADATADLETSNLHRVSLLKHAAALKEFGAFDRALERSFEAANLVSVPSGLVLVQHDVLLADIYLGAGMEDDGLRHLASAEKRAIENRYAHQLKAIDNILGSHLGIPLRDRFRSGLAQQFRPVDAPSLPE